jgi:hypothetical protein
MAVPAEPTRTTGELQEISHYVAGKQRLPERRTRPLRRGSSAGMREKRRTVKLGPHRCELVGNSRAYGAREPQKFVGSGHVLGGEALNRSSHPTYCRHDPAREHRVGDDRRTNAQEPRLSHFRSLACVRSRSFGPFGNHEHGPYEARHVDGMGDVLFNLGVARLPLPLQHEPDVPYPPLEQNAPFARFAALKHLEFGNYAPVSPSVQRSVGDRAALPPSSRSEPSAEGDAHSAVASLLNGSGHSIDVHRRGSVRGSE